MPDARLQRTRATLPEGYQFGDARQARSPLRFHRDAFPLVWPTPYLSPDDLTVDFHWSSYDKAMQGDVD